VRSALVNYTSEVPSSRSIADIETLLMEHGALSINKSAKNGKVDALAFSIPVNGAIANILLPANVQAVYSVLVKERESHATRPISISAAASLIAQAERTAWRIQLDWVRVQLSLVRMKQVELLQIFLPYVIDATGQTFYSQLKSRRYAGLLPAPNP